jgi:hypothetical protein
MGLRAFVVAAVAALAFGSESRAQAPDSTVAPTPPAPGTPAPSTPAPLTPAPAPRISTTPAPAAPAPGTPAPTTAPAPAAVVPKADSPPWGFKVGAAYANLSVSNDDELADQRIGISGGVYMQLPITPMLSIQPEALYTMKGDSGEETFGEGIGQTTIETDAGINYVEIPVLLRASFIPEGKIRPFLYGGPVLGINVGAEADITETEVVDFDEDGDAITQVESREADLGDQLHAFDFCVAVGGGIEIPIRSARNALGLEARYTHGVVNIVDSVGEVDDLIGADADVKTRTFAILASMRWL